MKVILKKAVKGVGKEEDLVEVSAGYANNFLIPKGLAVVADAKNINIMKSKKEAQKKRVEREIQEANELKERLKDITVKIKAKSGGAGRLFGSITSKDIVEELNKDFGIMIDKRKLNTDAIKTLGSHIIDVKLYANISGKLKVQVVEE